jgi:hypothetical protein
MDKALAYGARDSRFDPWQDRLIIAFSRYFVFEKVVSKLIYGIPMVRVINNEKVGLPFISVADADC